MARKKFKAKDGTPPSKSERKYRLNLYDTGRADINLFNSIDSEQIKLTGSLVRYFKYYQDSNYDDVFGEDRSKPISEDFIEVYAHYNPKSIEENLTDFGIELTNDQIFVFNKDDIEEALARKPIAGDQIVTDFQNIRYEIHEVQEDSFKIYGIYHYNCYAKVLRDNPETLNEDIEEGHYDL